MKISSLLTLLLLLLFASQASLAEELIPDSAVVGNWVSSTGAKIKIDYANEDTTEAVMMSINGGTPIRATVTNDRHNSVKIMYVLPDGTPMLGHYFGGEDVVRITDQGKLFATWRRG